MNKLPFLFFLLTLLGCGGADRQFSLYGDFDHLEQGEFLLYSHDGGMAQLDTLRLREGKFSHTLPLRGTATYCILYPNFSELTIFGQEGAKVKVKGDARSLNEVKVTGTDDNELYTQFRHQVQGLSTPQADSLARHYILNHPTSRVSTYLLEQHFVRSGRHDAATTWQIYDSLLRANPGDVALSNLAVHLRQQNALKVGERIPPFSLATRRVELSRYKGGKRHVRVIDPTTITDTTATHQPMLIVFWASWRSGSASGLFRARKERTAHHDSLAVLSYSLDVEDDQLRAVEQRDSVDYPSYCDFEAWHSHLVQEWGISELPFFILLSPQRHIVAMGNNWKDDIEPHTHKLWDEQ